MTQVFHEEWREENQDRRYPFVDTATLTNGLDVIPLRLFVDGSLYPVGNTGRLFLSRITRTPTSVELAVSDFGQGEVCTASVDDDDDPDLINFEDVYGRPAGVLLPDDPGLDTSLDVLRSWSLGDHLFTEPQTGFAVSCQVPTPHVGVRGLLLEDETLATDDVWLVGERGIQLWPQDGFIRVDAIGDRFLLIRECAGLDPALAFEFINRRPLKTINGILPDPLGDFSFTVAGELNDTQVLRINAGVNGLVLSGAL